MAKAKKPVRPKRMSKLEVARMLYEISPRYGILFAAENIVTPLPRRKRNG